MTTKKMQDLAPSGDSESIEAAVRSAGDGFIVTGLDGRVEFLNDTAERLTGIAMSAAQGLPLSSVLPLAESDGSPLHGNLTELAIVSDAPISLGQNLILAVPDQSARHVEGEIAPRRGESGVTGTVVTFRDVSLRNWEELQKREGQKMRAVSQLAGTVAHELNNLVTIVLGHAETLDDPTSATLPLAEAAAAIQQAGRDIAKVTRQLLTLSQRHVLQPEPVELDKLIEKAGPRIRGLLPASIDLILAPAAAGATVLVDRTHMEQALCDLVGHCRDRIPGDGVIRVSTRRVILDDGSRGRYLRRFIELRVSDTGPTLQGVPLETIFEPSWTKVPGRPPGLGLFALRSLASAARGHLSVESESETGVQFVMRLPEIEEEGATLEAIRDAETSVRTILLVEDDDNVRVLLHNSFEKRGYRVLEARDGEEALIQSDLHEGRIDMLVSDLVMPNMDGATLAREFLQTRPETKVLLISGCPDEVASIHPLLKAGAQFVQKPFSQRELVARVETILNSAETHVQAKS